MVDAQQMGSTRTDEVEPDFDAVVAAVHRVFDEKDVTAAADALAAQMWIVFLHRPDLVHAREFDLLDDFGIRVRGRERVVEALIEVERMTHDAGALIAELDHDPDDELWSIRLLAGGRWDLARGNPGGALSRIELAARMRGEQPAGTLAAQIIASLRCDALLAMGFARGRCGRDHPRDRGRRRAARDGPVAALFGRRGRRIGLRA